jgi:competence protein ComEC
MFCGAVILARRGWGFAATVTTLAGFFFLGAWSYRIAAHGVTNQPLVGLYDSMAMGARESPSLVEGRLRREAERREDATILWFDVDRIIFRDEVKNCQGGLRINARGDLRFRKRLDRLDAGDRLRLWVSMRRPRGFMNPGRFDVAAYLGRRAVTLTGSVKSALLIDRIEKAPWWRSLGSRLRRYVRVQIERSFESTPVTGSAAPGVVLALLVGDRSLIPAWASDLYQNAGTFHVIAISGAHVGVLAFLVYGGLRRMGVDQTPALLILAIFLPLYASLCGGRPSVVRAVLMSLCVIGSRLLSLDSPGINGLALSALLLLSLRPLDLHDPGFQLSFLATAAIFAFFGPITKTLAPWLGRLAPWIAISLAAQVGVLPILAWHFHRMTPGAVIANLVAMPLAGGLIVVGALLVILSPLPWAGGATAWIAWLMVKGLTLCSQLVLALPGGSIRVPAPGVLWVGVYLGSLAVAIVFRGRWRRGAVTAMCLLTLELVARPSPGTAPGRIRLTALDVGHGDALLIELPEGERLLVDGGGSTGRGFDMGESVVVPALLQLGIRSLHAVVVTHPDSDHIGGLPAVISSLRVKEIWDGGPDWRREGYRRLRERAGYRGVKVRYLAGGDELRMGEVAVRVLASPPIRGGTPHRGNEDSLVLHFSYGRAGIVLTGDAGEETELLLLGAAVDLRADVLKIGHHGSRSSTTPAFLERISPRVAVISTGHSGLFQLPSVEVLQRLRRRGITTLRTDRDGAITVSLDREGKIEMETFRTSF